MTEHTDMLIESRWADAVGSGWKTTLYDPDRLRELDRADTSVIGDTVDDWDGNSITEDDIIELEVERTITAYQTPERTMELPGLALERAQDHIRQFAAKYKNDNNTPSGTIKDVRRVGPDDIVFTFAGPEVYEEVSGTAVDTFEQTSLTSGNRLELVGDAGIDEGTNSNGNTLSLDDDEMMFFTGDYIDLSAGPSEVTKIVWEDIDGESYGPDQGLLSQRLSGTHLFTAQGAFVKSTCDLDAKIYASGDTEIVPIAFYMGPGSKAPTLV